jgi:hypothetical protein
MKLIRFVVFSISLFFTLNVYSNKQDIVEILSSIGDYYDNNDAPNVKIEYNKIRKLQELYFFKPEKNYIFITNLLRTHEKFNERIQRNINFLSYDPSTNSNSNETLVFVYHISCLLNKGINPILNALNENEVKNGAELAILLFNVWINELKQMFLIKLNQYDLTEQYDEFMVNVIPEINKIKGKQIISIEDSLFVKTHISEFTNYHKKFFGLPFVNFSTAIELLQHLPNSDNLIQNAITVFSLKGDVVKVEGYDLSTNTNIKEIFVYLWHLYSQTKDINPLLTSLIKINENISLTNAAIILSSEWAKQLNLHSFSKTKNQLQIQLQKKHIKNANTWMSDSLAEQWAAQYPTEYLFNLKARGFNPHQPFVVNYNSNQVDGINELTLYHHPRPGGGLCGYLCSSFEGRSPKECLDLLLEHCDNPHYIDLMFFDIKSTAWQVDFERPLQGQLPQSWIEDDYLITVLLNDDLLKQYLKVNTNLVREYLKGVITGAGFPGIDTRLTYIVHNDNEFTGTGIFDVLAELGGYNLIIYTSNPNNAYDLNINHYHQSPGADKDLHVLHRGGHYDLLSEAPWPIEFPVIF